MILLYILNSYTNCSADSFKNITQGIEEKKDHKYFSTIEGKYTAMFTSMGLVRIKKKVF